MQRHAAYLLLFLIRRPQRSKRKESSAASDVYKQQEAHFVKTSTGFGPGGATIEHVQLMRETVGQHAGVKASGGIRDRETALAMIEAGATRIGTSSGVRIVGD